MLNAEDNQLITQTGPGTPGGELFRRYWQPLALSEELPEGAPPMPVRLMSEDLTLFRDENGRLGLVALHCAHRAADLSYGRIENGGLRCLYHGWLYDVDGNCLEQPGEPEGSNFKDKVKLRAYPVIEKGQIIFAFLGVGEPPLLPTYEFLDVPEPHRLVTKYHHDCNYLQGNEGNIDPQHLSFLHKMLSEESSAPKVTNSSQTANTYFGADVTPHLEVDETDFGLRIFSVRQDSAETEYVRITNFIYPNLSAFPGGLNNGYGVNWHVPIDDTHHWKFSINFDRENPLDKSRLQAFRGKDTEDYRSTRNVTNRYLQDRNEMVATTFIGLGRNFQLHDKWATESEGTVQNRALEHLGYTDKAIAAERRLLLKAIRQVQEGGEAPHTTRKPEENHLEHLGAYAEVLPLNGDWNVLWKRRAEAAK
jgi:phenylpropionate dioxygenase-like ring-hydroxylating dioxygenase large terminal subunit